MGGKGGRELVRQLPHKAAMRGCTLVGGRRRHEPPKTVRSNVRPAVCGADAPLSLRCATRTNRHKA